MLLLAACAAFAAWVGTQYTAYCLGFHPRLGPWLYAAPEAQLAWWRAGAVVLVGGAILLLVWLRDRRWAPAGAVGCLGAGIVALAVSLGPVTPLHHSQLVGAVSFGTRMRCRDSHTSLGAGEGSTN